MGRRDWIVRRLTPDVSDVVFGLVLASVLIGGRYRLLNDPGTTWHERLGRDIIASGRVPRVDFLTFTRSGRPWVDQSWLFDVALATVVRLGGWPAAGAICAFGIAGVYGAFARGLMREGRSPVVVLTVGVLAAGVGAIHFLVRPHLLTMGGVLLFLRVCQRQHERGGNGVFALPLASIVWANVHGGFLAGPLILFTSAVAHLLSGPPDGARRRDTFKFALAGVFCLLAAMINPYGIKLYGHVAGLLVSSGVTALIEEYQPVPFGKPDARAYEWVLLALVALPAFTAARMTRYELAHALVWLHLSLASVRHAPLFALAVGPGLSRVLDGLTPSNSSAPPRAHVPSQSLVPVLALLGLVAAVLLRFPVASFDPAHWPLAAIPAVDRLPRNTRLFHEQDWGGLIEAKTRPPRATFVDDRFELFGKDGILRYLNAIEGGPDWDAIQRESLVNAVLIRPERGLARRLLHDPAWTPVFKDGVSLLLVKTPCRAPSPETPSAPGGRTEPGAAEVSATSGGTIPRFKTDPSGRSG